MDARGRHRFGVLVIGLQAELLVEERLVVVPAARHRPIGHRRSNSAAKTPTRRATLSLSPRCGAATAQLVGPPPPGATGGNGGNGGAGGDIFRATYERVGEGLWRRTGFVSARPASNGEDVSTLDGTTVAAQGAWIVRGERGEQWPVSAEEFARRYEGPVELN
ncbi:MAG: hypothetical protein QOC63_5126 [Mycobacterium sp.]|nr:hypothetical protein [Mycobacterium sp.]